VVHVHLQTRTHTYRIVHLEQHMEAQDAELDERTEMITDLEQQLLELQVQAESLDMSGLGAGHVRPESLESC
jgi:hypothetical protein